jgi:uncharacterized protein YydD (DUF2326 family)
MGQMIKNRHVEYMRFLKDNGFNEDQLTIVNALLQRYTEMASDGWQYEEIAQLNPLDRQEQYDEFLGEAECELRITMVK